MDSGPLIFTMSPEGIKKLKSRYWWLMAVLYLVYLNITGVILLLDPSLDFSTTAPICTLVSLFYIVIGIRKGRRAGKRWEGFFIVFDTLTITRIQTNSPDLVFYHGQINTIQIRQSGAIIIQGNLPGAVIAIPRDIDNYERLKILLEGFQPLTPFSYTYWTRAIAKAWVPFVAALVLYFWVVNSRNRNVILWLGPVAFLLCLWNLIRLLRNKQIPVRRKYLGIAWVYFMVSLLLRIIMTWLNVPQPY